MIGSPDEEQRKESFLDLYLRYTLGQESPEAFHLWVGVSILAAALGRKVYIDRGYYKLYPNIFCILVAGSARCRKSTAINIGIRLLQGIETTRVVAGKITPEKFLEELANGVEVTPGKEGEAPQYKAPATLVHSSELSVLLTKQSYGEPLIHLLTDLFDCPDKWEYKTKHKGTSTLHQVFLSILAATTPDGVAKGIPESALHEGFASRVLFCYQADTPRRNPFPVLTAEELSMYIRLRDILRERAKLEGEVKLSQNAMEWFHEWYQEFMADVAPERRLEGMYGRKHDHLLRIGMVLAASRGDLVVEQEDLEGALLALTNLESQISGAFAQLGGNENTPFIERAKAMMRKQKQMTWYEFCKRLEPADNGVCRIVRDTLINTGEIAFVNGDPQKLGWTGD